MLPRQGKSATTATDSVFIFDDRLARRGRELRECSTRPMSKLVSRPERSNLNRPRLYFHYEISYTPRRTVVDPTRCVVQTSHRPRPFPCPFFDVAGLARNVVGSRLFISEQDSSGAREEPRGSLAARHGDGGKVQTTAMALKLLTVPYAVAAELARPPDNTDAIGTGPRVSLRGSRSMRPSGTTGNSWGDVG